jgi:hypothetical protein
MAVDTTTPVLPDDKLPAGREPLNHFILVGIEDPVMTIVLDVQLPLILGAPGLYLFFVL